MLKTTVTNANIPHLIRDREEFTTNGALKGAVWDSDMMTAWDTGKLPNDYASALVLDLAGTTGDLYIVWSYGTPIAWHTEENGWRIPDAKYSVTTSKHQGKLYLIR